MRALFKSHQLIGDGLYISAALRAWYEGHRGWDIYIQTLPDHVAPLYEGMLDSNVKANVVFDRPDLTFDFEHTFDVNKSFILSDRKRQHIAKSYADLLGVEIGSRPQDVGPFYFPKTLSPEEYADKVAPYVGCILVSMFSASDASRGNPPGPRNKMLSWDKWVPLIRHLHEQYPETPIMFLGAPTDELPFELGQEDFTLRAIPLNTLALIMQRAKLLVTIDNGMSHLAASQKTPTFLFYPACLGTHYILPVGNPNLVYVQGDPNRVHPGQLLQGLKYACGKFEKVRK